MAVYSEKRYLNIYIFDRYRKSTIKKIKIRKICNVAFKKGKIAVVKLTLVFFRNDVRLKNAVVVTVASGIYCRHLRCCWR